LLATRFQRSNSQATTRDLMTMDTTANFSEEDLKEMMTALKQMKEEKERAEVYCSQPSPIWWLSL
jgi:hypothetical protein